MIKQDDINQAKKQVEEMEQDIKNAKKAIKDAEGGSIKDKVIDGMLNGLDVTVRAVCAGTHLGLKYSMDKVENIEASMAKMAHGVSKEETIKDRKRKTAETQLKVSQSYKEFKEKLHSLIALGSDVDEEIIKETVTS